MAAFRRWKAEKVILRGADFLQEAPRWKKSDKAVYTGWH
jgi:hypothetical protein